MQCKFKIGHYTDNALYRVKTKCPNCLHDNLNPKEVILNVCSTLTYHTLFLLFKQIIYNTNFSRNYIYCGLVGCRVFSEISGLFFIPCASSRKGCLVPDGPCQEGR